MEKGITRKTNIIITIVIFLSFTKMEFNNIGNEIPLIWGILFYCILLVAHYQRVQNQGGLLSRQFLIPYYTLIIKGIKEEYKHDFTLANYVKKTIILAVYLLGVYLLIIFLTIFFLWPSI